jgi:hypothetical protein
VSERPVLRIVRGDATPEELAALVAVVCAVAAGAATRDDAPPPSAWNDRAAALRRPLPHGPGAWHASAWPR